MLFEHIAIVGTLVFREALEAALFIGIMLAATRGISRRGFWVLLGITLGVIGSLIVAKLTDTINTLANGTGQEWFTIGVLSLAFVMLTWHVIWSQRHGRELAAQAKSLGAQAKSGQASLWAVSIAIAMIVLREGAETVLFVSGAMAANDAPVVQPAPAPLVQSVDLTQSEGAHNELPSSVDLTVAALPTSVDLTQTSDAVSTNPAAAAHVGSTEIPMANVALEVSSQAPITGQEVLTGGLAGLLLGVLVGAVMYFGLAQMPIGRLFSITNVFVVLLAAGMAGQIGAKLVQADVLPSGVSPLWDTSAFISGESGVGAFLNALMGYDAQPTATHVVFFVVGLLVILLASRWAKSMVKAPIQHKEV